MTAQEVESYVYRHFAARIKMCVPNVSHGLLNHEADMLILKRSDYLDEVEIKVSRADLKKDLEKRHGHKSRLIHQLWFAIPEKLEKNMDLIPAHAGILSIREVEYNYDKTRKFKRAVVLREPVPDRSAQKADTKTILKLGYLAHFRIWSLKSTVFNLHERLDELKKKNIYGGNN